MSAMLKLSQVIDQLSKRIGGAVLWLVLAAVLISSGNALTRKLFDLSSNAMLEIQWYLFSAVFLLGAGYTMLRQGHVKIDVIVGRCNRRTQVWIEIFGILFFLFPFVGIVIWLVWPLVVNAFLSGEMSENAGGLVRWPVYALVPLGFALLGLQGVSEFIKRIAFLRGIGEDPALQGQTQDTELALADEIRQRHVAGETINVVEEFVDMSAKKNKGGDPR